MVVVFPVLRSLRIAQPDTVRNRRNSIHRIFDRNGEDRRPMAYPKAVFHEQAPPRTS